MGGPRDLDLLERSSEELQDVEKELPKDQEDFLLPDLHSAFFANGACKAHEQHP